MDKKVKMRLPIFTGALGSTDIARINWEHFAIGAAISGITIVCGENVCGVDPRKTVLDNMTFLDTDIATPAASSIREPDRSLLKLWSLMNTLLLWSNS